MDTTTKNKWIVIVYQWKERENKACSCHPEWEYSGREELEIASFANDEGAAIFIAEKQFHYPNKQIRVIDQLGETEEYESLNQCGEDRAWLFDQYNAQEDPKRIGSFSGLQNLAEEKYKALVAVDKAEKERKKQEEEAKKAEQRRLELERKEKAEREAYEQLKAKFESK